MSCETRSLLAFRPLRLALRFSLASRAKRRRRCVLQCLTVFPQRLPHGNLCLRVFPAWRACRQVSLHRATQLRCCLAVHIRGKPLVEVAAVRDVVAHCFYLPEP